MCVLANASVAHPFVRRAGPPNAYHSRLQCAQPNCYSRIVSVDGVKKVVIVAARHIYAGEELSYDYQMSIEDVKIPCNCGAATCRKMMN